MDKKKEDCYQLWNICFSDSKWYMDFYFNEIMPNNTTLTLYEGNVLTSMLHLNPYTFQLGNKTCLLHYIVGVATKPAYRKQGRMRSLMVEAFQYMKKNKEPVTYLMPAEESIYLPFGFRYVYAQKRIWLDVNQMRRKDGDSPYRAVPWNQCGIKNQLKVCSFANETIQKNFNAYVVKTPYYYDRVQKEMNAAKGELLVVFQKEKILGVVSYMYEDGELEITETVCVREASLTVMREMYSYVTAEKEEGYVHTIMCLESAHLELPDSVILKAQKKSIIMMRIIDVETFLAHLPGREGEEFVISVKDEWISENNGTYRVTWKQDGASVVELVDGVGDQLYVEELFLVFQDRWRAYVNEII